ncbi:PREDICTED: uncharacterized protein C7orf62 homolog [Eufriesea mexicana]|uniref:uncharacterized protein C7orf62 homolog n=1 Tax=Eufriesea mexicana TaxID=516756 RepID=UPI00083C166F|nr:PREDICTED: uncharacterized protein C7orf62 homolog [Eufriesea mexicana]
MKHVVEPVRQSMLDIIRKNFHAAGKKMESIIQGLQEDHTNIIISGLLLVYPEYYVHILEASENIIYRHFEALNDNDSEDCKIGKAIFLPTYHNVHQRFFTRWFHVYVVPPILIQQLKSYELDDIQQQMLNCFNKIYILCDYISNIVCDNSVPMNEVVKTMNDQITRLYPESTLLEYLLNAESPVLLSIEEYLKISSSVPFINLYSDTIWPAPRDLMFNTDNEFEKDDRKSVDSTKHRRTSRRSTC